MGYIHFEVEIDQQSKINGKPCGDVVYHERDESATTVILCDGLGSGLKANIYANMCAARIKELLHSGFSFLKSFEAVVKTMEEAKELELPFAAFVIVRILNDGLTTILSYEMPPPLLISSRNSEVISQRFYNNDCSIIAESKLRLNLNEGILLVSDGVTQAGIGKTYPEGLKIEKVNSLVQNLLQNGIDPKEIPFLLNNDVKKIWGIKQGDDISSVYIHSRKGRVINLLTGPPENEDKDDDVLSEFLSLDGLKIICGASTAKIASRYLNKELKIDEDYISSFTPPNYELEGIDLVTEGVVTLNQVYNVWDAEFEKLEKHSPVTELYLLLSVADRVNFFVGGARNPVNDDISFKQLRILSRKTIVNLIAEKLRNDGALTVINYV